MSTAQTTSDSSHGMKLMYINHAASDQECGLQKDLNAIGASVAKVKQLDDILQRLRTEYFDAVLVDLDELENKGEVTVQRMQEEAPNVPVFVVGTESDFDDDRRAVEAIKAGAHDFIVTSKIQDMDLGLRIRTALARQVRDVSALNDKVRAANSIPAPVELSRAVALPAHAIAVRRNGEPDRMLTLNGKTVEITETGLRINVRGPDELQPGGTWVVGVEVENKMRYAYAIATRIEPQGDIYQVEMEFVVEGEDLFRDEHLAMRFDAVSGRYATPIPQSVLGAWVAEGVLQAEITDKELVCPSCHASATFRYGCRACGSGKLSRANMIHHFACAHIDSIDAFEQDDHLCCPKCRVRDLVVGADFEFLAGPFQCETCSWSDVQAELVGQCLSCQRRFTMQQALERELIQFHVDRLDPLAIIAAS